MSAWWGLHRVSMGLVKSLPLPLAHLAFRVYAKLLRTMAPSYVGRTYFGAYLLCDLRDFVQRTIFYFGVWEPDISHTIERSLGPGDVFVDIGANIGYDTLLAASRVGSDGSVVAIEASPRTFALLRDNIALNRWTNIRAVNVAVSDRPGRLELFEPYEGNIGAITTLASRGGRSLGVVEALPLGSILTPGEVARVRLIKLDVEGAEPAILRCLIDDLALFPSTLEIVVEASPHDDPSWNDIFSRLRASGFVAYELANSYEFDWYLKWRQPTPLRRVEVLEPRLQDLLFSRRSDLA